MSTITTSREARGVHHLATVALPEAGDAAQMIRHGDHLYAGHMTPQGFSVIDVANPEAPSLVRQMPLPEHAAGAKIQIGDGLLLVNSEKRGSLQPERTGLEVYSLDDPENPKHLGSWVSGGIGVHRMWYTGGRYAYLSVQPEGYSGRIFAIIDLDDPENPKEASRWWWPGMWTAGGEKPDWPSDLHYQLHHPIVKDGIAYGGFWDANLTIFDVSDPTAPELISRLPWAERGGCTHTCLPIRDGLLVVTDEAVVDFAKEPAKRIRLIDIKDVNNPREIGTLPVPVGDYVDRGGWSGPHNLHETRPGGFQSETTVFSTYNNAGLRVYDIGDVDRPREIASYVPDAADGFAVCQSNDVFVDPAGTIYLSDRFGGGIQVLALDEPRA